MKKIGVFDLDGTVYRGTLTFAVANELLKQPELRAIKNKVEAAKNTWKKYGSTEAYWVYNKTMLEVFETILINISPAALEAAAKKAMIRAQTNCYTYPVQLITKLKRENRVLVAISGSIKDLVEPFAHNLGFDIIISSELEIKNGTYTGKRINQTNINKDELLQNLVKERGLTLEDSIGIGDTHRDISFLSVVEKPIAFNPNAALYEEAATHGWQVVIERKNMVYELAAENGEYSIINAHPIHLDEHHEGQR